MHQIEAALSAFELVEHGKARAYLRREDAAWLQAAGVLAPATLVGPGALDRGRGARVALGGRQCFVKPYVRGGLLGRAFGDRYVSAARFGRDLAAGEVVRRSGVPAPAVLALVIETEGLLCRAWQISEFVEGLVELGSALAVRAGRARREILRGAGRAVRRMHDAGVAHPDLTLRNVAVDGAGTVMLLDFDRCTLAPWAARRRHNLFRLHRSARKAGVWRGGDAARAERRDIAAFLCGYRRKGDAARVAACAFAFYRAWERVHALFWTRS